VEDSSLDVALLDFVEALDAAYDPLADTRALLLPTEVSRVERWSFSDEIECDRLPVPTEDDGGGLSRCMSESGPEAAAIAEARVLDPAWRNSSVKAALSQLAASSSRL
jgi:hypothetical protein